MAKLTAKFKPVGKFFCKVKNAIKSVTSGFRKTKVWQVWKIFRLHSTLSYNGNQSCRESCGVFASLV